MTIGRWGDILRARIRSLAFRKRVETELEKELRFHLEQQMEENRARGMSADEARRAANRRLGGLTQIEEECRDMRRTDLIDTITQDLRYAARTLIKSPGFTITLVLTMALSIGATSAIVSVVNGVLLRALPYREPDRLVRFFTSNRNWPKFAINRNDFRDFRERLHSFESLAAYVHRDLQLAGTGETIRLSGFSITAGFFQLLGVKPAMGREFDRGDELPGRGQVAIVSNKIWRTRLGGRSDALGRKIILDGIPYTVVGVLAPGVAHPGNMYHAVGYGDTVDIWTPFTFTNPDDRGSHFLDGIGRLRPGVSVSQAQSEMNSAMRQLAREHPDGDGGWNVIVVPLQKEIVGSSERLLFVLLSVVSLVLLLACVNAANLLLARATARQREIGVRAAVGAARGRLIQQMVTESLLLAVVGGSLGALLMMVGVRTLVKALPADFPRSGDIHADIPVFIFTLFLAIATGLLFGVVPALQGSRVDLRDSLHERGRSTTSSQGTLRLRSMLVVCEVMLACVLLIGAGLLLRSFANLLHTDPGFRAEQVLTANVSLPREVYKETKAISGFYDRLLPHLRDMPGVIAAGAGSDLPWTGWDDNTGGFLIQGEVPLPHQEFHARYHMATPGYFQALGIPLLRGRLVEERDKAGRQNVPVINRQMARYWRHGEAIGGKISFDDHPKEQDWWTVIGIVGDVKDSPKSSAAEAGFWWPLAQEPFEQAEFSVAIRSTQDSKVVADRLRAVVRELDGNLAVADVRTMQNVAEGSYATPRLGLLLVGLFAALALTLAAIGTYAVISYSVEQRFHEFGVRMALGARSWDVTQTVLGDGMKLTAVGVLMGIVLGIALSRLLGGLLYGVTTADPFAVGATCLIVVLIAAIACYVPAWRATRADPMAALRSD